jgi:acyl-coenzyme A synthetase/AMP-(fatty) acid ligase
LGRLNDHIRLPGKIVYPSEIEGFVNEQPEVAEVAVIGVPGEHYDRIVAFIVLNDRAEISEQALLKSFADKLPETLMPHAIQFVEVLPKNANGKIIRKDLHKRFFKKELSS